MKKMNKRKVFYGVNNAVVIVGVLIVIALVNILTGALVNRFPSTKIDVTKDSVYKMSDATKNVLDQLDESDKKVHIYYMKDSADENLYVKNIVEKYLEKTDNLQYDVIYYVKEPAFAQRYESGDTPITEGSIIVEYDADENDTLAGKYRVIPYVSMIEYNASTYEVTGFKLESLLTNAISYVTSDNEVHAYFITGHGEPDVSELRTVLSEENIISDVINLRTSAIPDDTDILFILGPKYDPSAAEIEMIDEYLDTGGNIQVALDAGYSLPRLEDYLKEWGVTVNNDLVSEGNSKFRMDDDGLYIFPQISQHDITANTMNNELNVVTSMSRTLNYDDTYGYNYQVLLYTSKDALATKVDNGKLTEETSKGYFDLAYIVEKPISDEEGDVAKLLVSGSSSLWGLNDVYLSGIMSQASLANRAFFLDSVSYMAGLQNILISIDTKDLTVDMLYMSDTQQLVYEITICYALPILVFLAGFIIWLRRRHL